jgi:hypothetical protein
VDGQENVSGARGQNDSDVVIEAQRALPGRIEAQLASEIRRKLLEQSLHRQVP